MSGAAPPSPQAPGPSPFLSLRNLEKSFPQADGRLFVLRRISLDVAPGDFVTIMGPSGAGKSTLLALSMLQYQVSLRLLATLGFIALVLAGVGIYGVIAQLVAERTREIGIRIALGGDQRAVQRLVVRQGMMPAAIGVVAGLVLAPAVTLLTRGMLVGVSPFDPVTFLAVVVLLLAVALVACWMPARRAARVDPMVALRNE